MATRLKLFMGFFLVVCIIQLVHTAPDRIRREEPKKDGGMEGVIAKAREEVDKLLADENTMKFFETAANALSDLAKGLETQFKLVQETLTKGNEQKS